MIKQATTSNNTTTVIHPTFERQLFFTFLVCLLLMVTMQAAYASSSPMGDVLCSIVDLVYGNLGRGLASLSVIIIGVGATLGKTSWTLAITVAVGISVIFNAKIIVVLLGMGTPCV